MHHLRKWRHNGGKPRQQRCRANCAEFVIHLPRKQRERGSEDCAHRGIAREGRHRGGLVRVNDVRHGGREDEVSGRAERDRRKYRHDPMHFAVRRERQPEEPDRRQHGANLPHS